MLFILFMIGCGEEVKPALEPSSEGDILVDNDGDGFFSDEDCDDNDSGTFPTANEVCDGYDNNCDGQADEDVLSVFYVDSDGDGFGNQNITTQACDAPSGYTTNATDCDDTNAKTYPGAEELCDYEDNDCNSEVDDGTGQMFYVDSDGDGFGDENNQTESCDLSLGLSAVAGDCDDTNAFISPSATEVCDEIDNDCNEETDEGVATTFYIDEDEDGYGNPEITMEGCSLMEGYIDNQVDCNDTDTLINPSADEYCDMVDNNCDGVVDENYSVDASLFYADVDGDGFGNENNTILACSVPSGYVTNTEDCNDTNDVISPNSTEFCNGIDDNCDGQIDELGVSSNNTYFVDNDGDGFGQIDNTVTACSVPDGYSEESGDCDDDNNAIYPEAPELCNDEDDDCDEEIDEEITQTFYLDEDGDGFGTNDVTSVSCTILDGYVLVGDDCDDTTSLRSPNNNEICDEIDNDCDEDIDEESINALTFYIDIDDDGYGNSDTSIISCTLPEGHVENNLDCDDTTDVRSPGNAEICDGIDNDCNEVVDEQTGESLTVYYLDNDEDGFGDLNYTLPACAQPEGYVLNAEDCDDDDDDVRPDTDEVCGDGIDNNCDMLIDDDSAIDTMIWYEDGDNDTHPNPNNSIRSCEQPNGYIQCDSCSDENYMGDCDDDNNTIYPNHPEICDQNDNDCDEEIDEEITQTFYLDDDEDGFGTVDVSIYSCLISEGYVLNADDCDDSNPDSTIITEDSDCDGLLFSVDCDDENPDIGTSGTGESADCAGLSCLHILENGYSNGDGVYTIKPVDTAFDIYCDMTTDGGGWNVIWRIEDSLSIEQYTELTESIWQQNETEFLWHILNSDGSTEADVRTKFNNTYAHWEANHTGGDGGSLSSVATPDLEATWSIYIPSLSIDIQPTGIVRAVPFKGVAYSETAYGLHYKRTSQGEHYPWFDADGTMTDEGYLCNNVSSCGYSYGSIDGKTHIIAVR